VLGVGLTVRYSAVGVGVNSAVCEVASRRGIGALGGDVLRDLDNLRARRGVVYGLLTALLQYVCINA